MPGQLYIRHDEFAEHKLYGSRPPRLKIIMEDVRERAEKEDIKIPNRVSVGGTTGQPTCYISWTSNKMKGLVTEIAKGYGCKVFDDSVWDAERSKLVMGKEL